MTMTPPWTVRTVSIVGALAGASVWALSTGLTLVFTSDPSAVLMTPPAVLLGFLPLVVAVAAGAVFSRSERDLACRRRLRADLAAQTAKRRELTEELAQLHAVELSTLTDLEECEAELTARGEVLCSLGEAVRDAMLAVDNDLDNLRVQADEQYAGHIAHISQQVGDLMDLVHDATLFATEEQGADRTPMFRLVEVISRAARNAAALTDADQALPWSMDPAAPAWVHGNPDGLDAIVRSVVRDAVRAGVHPIVLQLDLVQSGGTTGLRISCGAGPLDPVSVGLSSRIAEVMGQPPFYTSTGTSGMFWFQEPISPGGVHAPMRHGRVLVASDAPSVRARLRRLLSRWGFACEVARSTPEVMALLETDEQAFDVMILDLHQASLPTLSQIRASAEHADLPVLVLSPDVENLVWLRPEGRTELTRSVRQETLLQGVHQAVLPRMERAQPTQQGLRQGVGQES